MKIKYPRASEPIGQLAHKIKPQQKKLKVSYGGS